jgi:hypothetical protein
MEDKAAVGGEGNIAVVTPPKIREILGGFVQGKTRKKGKTKRSCPPLRILQTCT